jgi:hypothetical protein
MNKLVKYGLIALVAVAAIFAATKIAPQLVSQKAPVVTGDSDDGQTVDAIQKQIDTLKGQTADGFTAVNSRLDGLDQAIKNLQQKGQQPINVHVEVNPTITMPASSGYYIPPPTPTYTPPPAAAPPAPAPTPTVTTVQRDNGGRVIYRGGEDRVVYTGGQTRYVGEDYGYQQRGGYQNYGGYSREYQSQPQARRQVTQTQQRQRQRQVVTCPNGRGNGPGPSSGSIFRPSGNRGSSAICATRGNGPGPSSGSIFRAGSGGNRGSSLVSSRGSSSGRSSGSITRPSSRHS